MPKPTRPNLHQIILARLNGRKRGQSFLELALVLPILLLILMGLVEVAIFIGRYLDVLDLTREAARFASVRDPFTIIMTSPNFDCSDPNQFFFYFQTACIFSPPSNPTCVANHDPFCNGMNAYVSMNPETDDVVISAYTVDGSNIVSDVHPKPNADPRFSGAAYIDEGGRTSYYWALSDHDADTTHNGNWQKDCKGNVQSGKIPYYSLTRVQDITSSTSLNDANGTPVVAPSSKGFVAIEMYYCYTQALSLPIFTVFVPNPLMIHAYTIMPLPAAAPTPTPHP
jgi:hypothetical protein